MSCRQLAGAWTEWRRVSQAYSAAGIAGSLVNGALGPAVYCPACAVVTTVSDGSSSAVTSTAGIDSTMTRAARHHIRRMFVLLQLQVTVFGVVEAPTTAATSNSCCPSETYHGSTSMMLNPRSA